MVSLKHDISNEIVNFVCHQLYDKDARNGKGDLKNVGENEIDEYYNDKLISIHFINSLYKVIVHSALKQNCL